MRLFSRAAGLAFGFALFYAVRVWLGGFMAALQVPAEFFRWAGQEQALAAISVFLHFLPTVLLLVLGTLVFAVPFKRGARQVANSVITGAAVGYVFWSVAFAIQRTQAGSSFLPSLMAQFAAPVWWAWPTQAAPFAALTLSYVASFKLLPPRAEA